MNSLEKLEFIQSKNNSILCIGLDTQLNKLPTYLQDDLEGIFNFNCSIIDATKDVTSAYKINFAFYEQYGWQGIQIMQKTLKYIPKDIYTIADAKRTDIGNTSRAYAASIFNEMCFDSVTLSPYIGSDSVTPFLDYKDKMVFILALTSNPSSDEFQRLNCDGQPLYMRVIQKFKDAGGDLQIGFVVGATHPKDIEKIRAEAPFNYLLVPGIGTQGGDVEKVLSANKRRNILINVSRDIIYKDCSENFAESSRNQALYYSELFNEINLKLLYNK